MQEPPPRRRLRQRLLSFLRRLLRVNEAFIQPMTAAAGRIFEGICGGRTATATPVRGRYSRRPCGSPPSSSSTSRHHRCRPALRRCEARRCGSISTRGSYPGCSTCAVPPRSRVISCAASSAVSTPHALGKLQVPEGLRAAPCRGVVVYRDANVEASATGVITLRPSRTHVAPRLVCAELPRGGWK